MPEPKDQKDKGAAQKTDAYDLVGLFSTIQFGKQISDQKSNGVGKYPCRENEGLEPKVDGHEFIGDQVAGDQGGEK
jgi:hypothetical protein